MSILQNFLQSLASIKDIIQAIEQAGGTCYLVGGSVRDLLMERVVKDTRVHDTCIKDIDIEVHQMSMQALESLLQRFEGVSLVGKQFGVLKLHNQQLDIDWSLPRRDSKGRKPTIVVDPDMTIQEASKRRDVTINAMAINLHTLLETNPRDVSQIEVLDFYGGLDDLKKRVLRAVDSTLFLDDPLRFYRVMQFVSRFEMTPDEELTGVCQGIDFKGEGGELARERIYEEIKKMLLKSKRPSLGFRWVASIGVLSDVFPELAALVDIDQRTDYHPEGNVFEHTMQSLDASAEMAYADEKEKLICMLGVLCHDLGKAVTEQEGRGARGHDVAGVGVTKIFLKRFTWDSFLINAVCKLVRYHRAPLLLVEQASTIKAYKRLALKLAPEVNFTQLYLVAWADVRGRNKDGHEPLKHGLKDNDETLQQFLDNVKKADVVHGPEEPILQGRDLLDVIKPGPEMGRLLKCAYDIQIEEGLRDKEELKKRVLKG